MSGKDRDHVMTGFGFGPIQAGLFFHEAFVSGRFSRLVAAEVDAGMVRAVNDTAMRSISRGPPASSRWWSGASS
jgi:hypothetical protein